MNIWETSNTISWKEICSASEFFVIGKTPKSWQDFLLLLRPKRQEQLEGSPGP